MDTHVVLYGHIDREACNSVQAHIGDELARGVTRVHLALAGGGADPAAATALYDFLRDASAEVRTYNFGRISVGGLLIFLAGSSRIACPYSAVFVAEPMSDPLETSRAGEADIRGYKNRLDDFTSRVAGAVEAATSMTGSAASAFVRTDNLISAHNQSGLGLATDIGYGFLAPGCAPWCYPTATKPGGEHEALHPYRQVRVESVDGAAVVALLHALFPLPGSTDTTKLTVGVSGLGGDLEAATAVYHLLRAFPGHVRTHSYGQVETASVVVLCGGDERTMVPRQSALLNKPRVRLRGGFQETAIEAWVRHLARHEELAATLIAERTTLDRVDLARSISRGERMPVGQALQCGLVSREDTSMTDPALPTKVIRGRR